MSKVYQSQRWQKCVIFLTRQNYDSPMTTFFVNCEVIVTEFTVYMPYHIDITVTYPVDVT